MSKNILNYQIIDNTGSRNAPWVVFIHGAGGSLKTWSRQTDAFTPHFRLLLIDLRDHGDSKNISKSESDYKFDLITDDIYNTLLDAGINKAHFVTLSFGSVVLQHFMMKHPEIVNKSVVAGGVFKADLLIWFFVKTAKFVNYFIPFRWMYIIFSFLLMPKKRNKLARRIYQKQALKLTSKEYYRWLGLYNEFFQLLKRFSLMTFDSKQLIVMGSEDFVFLKSAIQYAQSQAGVFIKVIKKAGHICNIEEPEVFNQLAIDFLLNIEPKLEIQPSMAHSRGNSF